MIDHTRYHNLPQDTVNAVAAAIFEEVDFEQPRLNGRDYGHRGWAKIECGYEIDFVGTSVQIRAWANGESEDRRREAEVDEMEEFAITETEAGIFVEYEGTPIPASEVPWPDIVNGMLYSVTDRVYDEL